MKCSSEAPMLRTEKERAMCFVPAQFAPVKRSKLNLVERFAFTGDVDGDCVGDNGFKAATKLLDELGFAYIAHTTTNSTVASNRYRIILPFDRPLSSAHSEQAWFSINEMLGSIFDPRTFDSSRLSILPQQWQGSPTKAETGTGWSDEDAFHGFSYGCGSFLDTHAVISAYPARIPQQVEPQTYSAPIDLFTGCIEYPDLEMLTDLEHSPLVTRRMIQEYLSAPKGGRFYRFMCRASGRALALGIRCDEAALMKLAMAMNRLADNSPRPKALREATRALQFSAASHHHSNFQQIRMIENLTIKSN